MYNIHSENAEIDISAHRLKQTFLGIGESLIRPNKSKLCRKRLIFLMNQACVLLSSSCIFISAQRKIVMVENLIGSRFFCFIIIIIIVLLQPLRAEVPRGCRARATRKMTVSLPGWRREKEPQSLSSQRRTLSPSKKQRIRVKSCLSLSP